MNLSGWNMYIFRDGRRRAEGAELTGALENELAAWQKAGTGQVADRALSALIAAGELECALADCGTEDDAAEDAAQLTSALAEAFLTGRREHIPVLRQMASGLPMEGEYEVAVQEGFAYYALHPCKVAVLVNSLPLRPRMAVIGIRSIGAVLSAVACAALRVRGTECRRITVRPGGHPYDRKLELTPGLRRWIAEQEDAGFLVLDEGPGISGSSFLAVLEALVACGVPRERVRLIGSREVSPETLRAEDAAARWPRKAFHVLSQDPIPPAGAGVSLSGGSWRRHFICAQEEMPASWAQLEPAKFLSRDGQGLYRFEGFGRYGENVGNRARRMAERGFAPRYLGSDNGFGEYEIVPGRMLTYRELSPSVIERMASYLAARGEEFTNCGEQSPELQEMLRWNWQLEFDETLSEEELTLAGERVVVCDGQMMPHEWLRTNSGRLLKLDGSSHGDNHFFPGPCDIAWDVAGAAVEWRMTEEQRERFVTAYEERSGDRISARLAPYLLAYTTFRMGWSKMAALAMEGEFDEALLERDYLHYREMALRLREGMQSNSLRAA